MGSEHRLVFAIVGAHPCGRWAWHTPSTAVLKTIAHGVGSYKKIQPLLGAQGAQPRQNAGADCPVCVLTAWSFSL